MPKVKGKEQLCSCEKKYFKSEQGLAGRTLFDRYDAIENIVNKKIDERYHHFLAQPVVEGDSITWFSKSYSEIPQRLSDLQGEERIRYEQIKNETLEHYKSVIGSLKLEGKSNEAEGLENATKFINNDFVYCFDGKTVLGIWGMQLRDEVREPIGTAVKDMFVKKKEQKLPVVDDIHYPTPEPIPDSPTPDPVVPFTIRFNAGEGGNLNGNSELTKHMGEIISEGEVPKIVPKEGYEFTNWDRNPNDYSVTNDTEFKAQYRVIEIPNPSDDPTVPPLPWYKRFWNWLRTLFLGRGCLKWLIWLLLFLLLLFLLAWLFRSCNHNGAGGGVIGGNDSTWVNDDPRSGGGGIYNPGNPYNPTPTPTEPGVGDILPPQQGVLPPIDTTKIIRKPGNPVIISNRLNILMENEDKSIIQFAKDFKAKYPDEKYKIVYFDDVVKRMQIEMPPEEREQLKLEIPRKFSPEYELFVFDEALFECKYNPNDPAFADKNKSWYLYAVKAPQAWDITRGSEKIVIAIVDNGFNLQHPELKSKVVMPYNVWTHSKEIFPQQVDHGTHVAGTALAIIDNGKGLSGIAPVCRFMPVQVADASGNMTTTSILDGVLYALYQGADVVNISLGTNFTGLGTMPPDSQQDMIRNRFKEEERLWTEIMKIADKHKSTIVVAAGNDNVLAGIDPLHRPTRIVTVSAVDKSNQNHSKASFSNYGSYSTISAPGVDIYSTIDSNGYTEMDGTSMAAPIVTGGIALMKSINDTLTTKQIIEILQITGLPTKGNIGKLIQLDKVLQMLESGNIPDCNDCEKVNEKIDSLQREIDRLKKVCSGDTLKMTDITQPQSLNGKWMSTEELYNNDKEPVTLYYEFSGNKGTFTLVEKNGLTCSAPLSVTAKSNSLSIWQTGATTCSDGKRYQEYIFKTYADDNGNVVCEAQNTSRKSNYVKFYLVRIN